MNSFSQPPVFAYLETTIPVGMTISEYRVARPPKPSRRERALAALRRHAPERVALESSLAATSAAMRTEQC